MSYILFFILILAIAILVYFLAVRGKKEGGFSLARARQIKQENKEKAKQRILELFKNQEKVYNNDVENMLSVSEATATRYLEELEKEDKVTQHGTIGQGVYYTK